MRQLSIPYLLATVYCLLILPSLYAFNVRSDSMGSAGVSVVDDLNSLRLNPAGLSVLEEDQLAINLGQRRSDFFGVDYARVIKNLGVIGGYFGGNFTGEKGYFLGAAIGRKDRIVSASMDFSWGARLGIISSEDKNTTVDLGGGVKYKVGEYDLGVGFFTLLSVSRRMQLGVSRKFDEFLVATDIDTNGRIYLGAETGVYAELCRLRFGINTQDKTLTTGLSAYMWPYGLEIFYAIPWNFKDSGSFAFSFIYRFGGYDFSQELLNKNTEKAISLDRKIADMKTEISVLKKNLKATQEAYKKAKELVDILDHEASEIIKKRLQMMRGLAEPQPVETPAKDAVKPRVKETITLPTKHKVSRGDSLRSIAQQYYGDPNKWQLIYEANRDKIERGMPKIGEELIIPKP